MCNIKFHNYKVEIKSCKCKYFSHFLMSCLNYYNDFFQHHSKLEMSKTNQPFVALMAISFYYYYGHVLFCILGSYNHITCKNENIKLLERNPIYNV